ncbi:MAG: FixH family protein [Flavobacteriales bacterium]
MKFNWGVFAFSLFGVFVVFMLTLAYFATKQNNELVTDNYYEKELEFKEILIKKQNTSTLTEQVTFNITEESIEVLFPKEIGEHITGKLLFYKPSNEQSDKEFDIQLTNHTQFIPTATFQKGMYHVKIDWAANNTDYFNEISIVIP